MLCYLCLTLKISSGYRSLIYLYITIKIGGHRRLTQSTHEICRSTYNHSQTKRPSAILNLQNFDTLIIDHSWNQIMQQHTKFHWNRMIRNWDIVRKPFFWKWRPSAILNFRKLPFSSRGVSERGSTCIYQIPCQLDNKLWRYSQNPIFNMEADRHFEFHSFFYKSACDHSWNQNLSLHTKFHPNRMIPGRDIAIKVKPFSKWWPSAILNFQNLVFWSCDYV